MANLDIELKIPTHVAFIMDGNGRWATKRGMPRKAGHVVGAKTFHRLAHYCGELGIKYMTVYAFSTENWKRSEEEVSALMKIFDEYIDIFKKDTIAQDAKIRFIGDLSRFPDELRRKMIEVEEKSVMRKMCLNVAVNYGGRNEIKNAVNELIKEGKTEITEEDISSHLYTGGQPDPDLIIRTGGEIRVSNFLLWQNAYSEFYFTDILWPDFKNSDLDEAIRYYSSKQRRFGGVIS